MKKFVRKMTMTAAVLMLCTAGVSAAEIVDEGSYQNDSVKWTLDDEGLLTVYGEEMYEERMSADQVYPKEPEPASWGIGRTDIKTVVIREGVLRIPDSAFNGCVNLESIEISGTVTSIGHNAFDGCAALETITIPSSVTSIGSYPFRGCTSLTAITAEEGSPYFYSDENGVLYVGSDGIPGGILAYPAANPAKEYVFPETVRSVDSYAFAEARNLESVTLSGQVDWILEYAFQNCTALTEVNAPDDLAVHCTSMVFDGCTSLDPAFIEEFCWDAVFYDVLPDDEYFNAVKFVNKAGLFLGISDYDFGSADTMNRAMFVTVLGRMAELQDFRTDETLVEVNFEDVPEGQWYTDYVKWAATNDIVLGYGDGTFGVNDAVTVEQAVVILARYAGVTEGPAYDIEGDYADADELSGWAKNAMRWAVMKGIYTGDGDRLNPQTPASRVLVAEMLYYYTKAYPSEKNDWGISMSAEGVTPNGLTLVFVFSGKQPSGILEHGSDYVLEYRKGSEWLPVSEKPFDFTAEAWVLLLEDIAERPDKVEWTIDWTSLYGILPAGQYRIGKEIMNFRDGDDYDTAVFYAEFTIE